MQKHHSNEHLADVDKLLTKRNQDFRARTQREQSWKLLFGCGARRGDDSWTGSANPTAHPRLRPPGVVASVSLDKGVGCGGILIKPQAAAFSRIRISLCSVKDAFDRPRPPRRRVFSLQQGQSCLVRAQVSKTLG